MKIASASITDHQSIPPDYAFCARQPAEPGNRNPDLNWTDVPEGTRSLALICHDPDVPQSFEDANQEGRTVAKDAPRRDFYHWVLVDIPAETSGIADGEYSDRVTAGGKAGPDARYGTRQGLNSFTELFKGDDQMAGAYYGYDGPCPPWNDERVHRYVFTLYALDVERCPLEEDFTGPDVLRAIEGHILDRTTLTGLYSMNPEVRG